MSLLPCRVQALMKPIWKLAATNSERDSFSWEFLKICAWSLGRSIWWLASTHLKLESFLWEFLEISA